MVRRSEPKTKRDEREFPIRLRFKLPEGGLSRGGWKVEHWLGDNLGSYDHAVHVSGHSHFGVYLRSLADAQRFVDAFPQLTLADGIAQEYGLREPPKPPGYQYMFQGPGPGGYP